ncbi:MAG: hypothetical protein ATN35_08820 [Epulopiscium sp. Nele67-Bin004]|nr:MAG: hypothetical protein ATN35_08820 [Epulopiscium sp. Nele67-Bin004]
MKTKDFMKGLACGMTLLTVTSVFARTGTPLIEVTYRDMKVFVEGKEVQLESSVEPFIYNGTTYLPIRAVGEAFGKEVEFDSATGHVYIGDKPMGDVVTLAEAMTGVQTINTSLSTMTSVSSNYGGTGWIYNKGEKVDFEKLYYAKDGSKSSSFYVNQKYQSIRFRLAIPENSSGSNSGAIVIGDYNNMREGISTYNKSIYDVALFTSADIIGGVASSSSDISVSFLSNEKVYRVQQGFTIREYEVDISDVEVLSIWLSSTNMYMLDPVLVPKQ